MEKLDPRALGGRRHQPGPAVHQRLPAIPSLAGSGLRDSGRSREGESCASQRRTEGALPDGIAFFWARSYVIDEHRLRTLGRGAGGREP
jgi:hypothetical protein